MFEIIPLTITALATYGVSRLLTEYSGPGSIFLQMRVALPNSPLDCVVCTSVWVAALFFGILLIGGGYLLTPFAIVGVVMLLEDV